MAVPDGQVTVGRWPESGNNIWLPAKIHRQPIYALGISGVGKSVLLGNLALQWNALGDGVLLIDVKDGALARDVAMRADPAKLILVSPGTTIFDDRPYHWGLNLLELPSRDRSTVSQAVNNVMSMLERLDRADYTQMTLLRTQLDTAVRLALYEPEPNLRLVRRMLTDEDLRKRAMEDHKDYLNEEITDHFRRFDDPKANSAYGRNQQITSTVNRLKEILTPPELAYMLLQEHSTIRLREWLEDGKLVVVDCVTSLDDRPPVADRVAELMGNLILTQMMHFTFSRKLDPDNDPWTGRTRAIRLICDEFDLLAGNNFARLLTKARSYRVFPVMAHQNKDQLRVGRDAAQTLYNAASGVPIEFNFTLTDADRRTMRTLRPDDDDEEPGKFRARFLLRRDSLPLGLLDRGQSVTIALHNWRVPADEARYEAALQAQRKFVTDERALKFRMMEGKHADEDPPRATHHQRRQGQNPSQKPRENPPAGPAPGQPSLLPDSDAVAAGPPRLSRPAFGGNQKRRRGPNR